MQLEDYLYQADYYLSDEKAGKAARQQYPLSEELWTHIKEAQEAIKRINGWLFEHTSRRCP